MAAMSSSLVFTKLRSTPLLGLSFALTPLCSRRAKRMAHSLTRATLGLTHPSPIEPPKGNLGNSGRAWTSNLGLQFGPGQVSSQLGLGLNNLRTCSNLPELHPKFISFAAKEIDLVEWKGDILAVGVTEKDMAKDENSKFQNSILKKLDSHLGGLLAEALPGLGSKRIGLIGLGQCASTTTAYSSLGEAVAGAAKAAQASNVAIVLASSEGLSANSKLSTASAIASGTVLGIYEDNRFKSESKKPALSSVDILGLGTGPEVEKKLRVLAEEASKIATMYSDVFSATILDAEQCKELKMGSYLGVAAASANPPHFIHLCYKPPSGPVKAKLALVGKGLTFDSGGYNIKAGPGIIIELMKFDMGGSAAVLGAAKALGEIKPAGS
ncbi:unnamed protein product [Camellia sinensis]